MQDQNETSILEDLRVPIKRRTLLPWWMKFFCWFFMFLGAVVICCIIARSFGVYSLMDLYGLQTNDPFSLVGLILSTTALFKAFTAWALWFEKDDAIKLGIVDAAIGIVLTLTVMLVLPYTIHGFPTNYRGEIILLIPYLIRLDKIKKPWERKTSVYQVY